MSARGQKFTPKWKAPVYYQDFVDEFEKNPTTGALRVLTNEDSINQAIRNLVYTSPGERVGRNSLGSKAVSSLFDLATPASLKVLEGAIKDTIENFEPRVDTVQVSVSDADIQNNTVQVTISYRPINLPQTVTLQILLKRAR